MVFFYNNHSIKNPSGVVFIITNYQLKELSIIHCLPITN